MMKVGWKHWSFTALIALAGVVIFAQGYLQYGSEIFWGIGTAYVIFGVFMFAVWFKDHWIFYWLRSRKG